MPRKTGVVFLAAEALLLSGRHDFTIRDQGRRTIVVERRYAQDFMREKLERRRGRSKDRVDERSHGELCVSTTRAPNKQRQDHQRNQPEFFSRTEKSKQFEHKRHTAYTGNTAA